jgi:hypothetical protein
MFQKIMDSSGRPLVTVIDMPVHIGSDKAKIKEVIKGW